MSSIPSVQYRIQNAEIGINLTRGQMQIRQPPTLMEIETTPLRLEIQGAFQTPPGNMKIDQSRAYEALGKGSTFWFKGRVADESKQIALQAIGDIVARGNRIGDIAKNKGNVIAEMAQESFFRDYKFNYEGPFELDNVDISYDAVPAEIKFSGAEAKLNYRWSPTEIQYQPAKVEIYLQQKPSFEMIPPSIDIKV